MEADGNGRLARTVGALGNDGSPRGLFEGLLGFPGTVLPSSESDDDESDDIAMTSACCFVLHTDILFPFLFFTKGPDVEVPARPDKMSWTSSSDSDSEEDESARM